MARREAANSGREAFEVTAAVYEAPELEL